MKLIAVFLLLFALGAEDKKANELLEVALTKETIEGDLKGAVELYEQAVKEAGTNRVVAVRALMRLAAGYQRLGDDRAREAYERVVRDYADQSEVAAQAAARLRPSTRNAAVVAADRPVVVNFRQITLFDRRGKVLGTVADTGPNGAMSLSPDATRVALVREGKIRIYDRKTQNFILLTEGPIDNQPTWSSDGKRIAFEVRSGQAERQRGVYITSADGKGKEEFIAPLTGVTLGGWSPDGRYLTFQRTGRNTGADLWVLPLEGNREPLPLLATALPEVGLRISPDGRYMSYRLTEGGRTDVYVSPFKLPATAEPDPAGILERWRISPGPGAAVADVRWRSDGKELYYIDVDGGVAAVEVTTIPTFKASTPKVLFQAPKPYAAAGDTTAGYSDVSANGQVFALMVPLTNQ